MTLPVTTSERESRSATTHPDMKNAYIVGEVKVARSKHLAPYTFTCAVCTYLRSFHSGGETPAIKCCDEPLAR
jgi:hypothetical protein